MSKKEPFKTSLPKDLVRFDFRGCSVTKKFAPNRYVNLRPVYLTKAESNALHKETGESAILVWMVDSRKQSDEPVRVWLPTLPPLEFYGDDIEAAQRDLENARRAKDNLLAEIEQMEQQLGTFDLSEFEDFNQHKKLVEKINHAREFLIPLADEHIRESTKIVNTMKAAFAGEKFTELDEARQEEELSILEDLWELMLRRHKQYVRRELSLAYLSEHRAHTDSTRLTNPFLDIIKYLEPLDIGGVLVGAKKEKLLQFADRVLTRLDIQLPTDELE